MLKSVKDAKAAIRLLYDIYKDGGFKLTKIIINKVEVLQSVTKTKKRKGVKNVDLNNRIDLPTEKHLE